MTSRLPPTPQDALSAEEREVAAHLAKLDGSAAPSAAMDSRVLAMARGAVGTPRRRTARGWPGALGAAAVLVAAVGLAWQLKPMFALGPPPIRSEHSGSGQSGVESDVVVAVESVPRRAPDPVAETGAVAAQAEPSAAVRRAAPATGGAAAARVAAPAAAQAKAPPAPPDEFEDAMNVAPRSVEAPSPPPASVAADAATAAPPPAAAERRAVEPGSIGVTGSRIRNATTTGAAAPDISADTRLGTRAWLARIRDRRDNGDLAGARASLERFVARHPRVTVPRDLRPLLPEPDPWNP